MRGNTMLYVIGGTLEESILTDWDLIELAEKKSTVIPLARNAKYSLCFHKVKSTLIFY